MKLTIFAATGGIGRQLLEQALAAGHDVTAVVRNPGKLTRQVRAVTADLAAADPAALESAVAGADAVLSGLGPHSNADAGIAAPGTRPSSRRCRPPASAASSSSAPRRSAPWPRPAARTRPGTTRATGSSCATCSAGSRQRRFGKVYTDLALMEDILRDSGLDWTVVRPPQLTGKPLTGTYRTAFGQNLRGGLSVPRADVAHLMLTRARPARDDQAGHRHRQLARRAHDHERETTEAP